MRHLLVLCALVSSGCAVGEIEKDLGTEAQAGAKDATYVYRSFHSPDRTAVYSGNGKKWLATFTDGAYTVRLRGPARTFVESTAAAPVTHDSWVRVLDAPFAGSVDEAWLTQALADTSTDVLAAAMQYLAGAEPLMSDTLQIAGDADYGPLVDGSRQEGSDFNDYLGVPWTYASGSVDEPEATQFHSLDCSGYLRMVWGYRIGMPLTLTPLADSSAIPRRSFEIYASAPGVITIPDRGVPSTNLNDLYPGDLVFFDASSDDGTRIDHAGTFIGRDDLGHYRFLSSRKTPNGPTMGDYGGPSILDGDGTWLYARSFRAARRL